MTSCIRLDFLTPYIRLNSLIYGIRLDFLYVDNQARLGNGRGALLTAASPDAGQFES